MMATLDVLQVRRLNGGYRTRETIAASARCTLEADHFKPGRVCGQRTSSLVSDRRRNSRHGQRLIPAADKTKPVIRQNSERFRRCLDALKK